jgi:hypothetical protein
MATTIVKLAKPEPPIRIFDPLPPRCGKHRMPITGSGSLRTCTSSRDSQCMFVPDPRGRGWITAADRIRLLKGGF